MTMPCGNTQAEKDRDTQTDHAEQTRFIAEESRWIRTLNDLLAGKTINGMNLADRMADQYQDFADKVDNDIDFMSEYLAGEYGENLNNLFKQEARTLASIICGV